MKNVVCAVVIAVVILISTVAVFVYPQIRNMPSEYATVDAIHRLEEFIRANDGKWPASEEELFGKAGFAERVFIDYTAMTSDLIADPKKLRQAIRPISGELFTYPHYENSLSLLLKAMEEAED